MKKSELPKALDRLNSIDAKLKDLYAERDQIERALIDAVENSNGGSLRLSDGRVVGLRDNFCAADGTRRNVAFKTAAVKRFDLVVSQPA